MELQINCDQCIKYTAPADPSGAFGFCRQYNTEVAVDKFLESCPGAKRVAGAKAPPPPMNPMDILEAQADEIVTLQSAIHAMNVRQETMQDKVDLLIDAVNGLKGGDPIPQADTPTPTENAQTTPLGPAKAVVKKVAKKKTAKKS